MPRRIPGLLALALSLSMVACDGTAVGEPGLISLMLTDEAGDFTQASVTIRRVELVGDGQPVLLLDKPFTTDLLTLSNDIAAIAEDVTVPAGTYSQLRFVIPEACIRVDQGVEGDEDDLVYASTGFGECGEPDGELQLPSYDQSGLKVSFSGAIQVDGDAHILLVDFDVSESFGQLAGMSGTWVMHPLIVAENISLSGILTVELTAAEGVELGAECSLGNFQASVGEPEPVAFTDGDGDETYTATFVYLMPGDYEVEVLLPECAAGVTVATEATQPVTVGSGAAASIAFEVVPIAQ